MRTRQTTNPPLAMITNDYQWLASVNSKSMHVIPFEPTCSTVSRRLVNPAKLHLHTTFCSNSRSIPKVPGTRTDIISGSSSSNQRPLAHPLATPSSPTVQYVQYTEYWMYLLYFVQQRVSNTKSENQPPSRTRLGPTTAPSQMAHDDLARPLTSQCIGIQSPSHAYWVWFSLLQTTFRDTARDTTEIQVFTLTLVSHCIHTHSG